MLLLILILSIIGFIDCDTPANCTYEDIQGSWLIREGPRIHSKGVDCTNDAILESDANSTQTFQVQLLFPNVAIDEHGNQGFWTLVYNQGFEIRINYRTYYAFSKWSQHGKVVTSFCHETIPGSSHDVLNNNWACYQTQKLSAPIIKKHSVREPVLEETRHLFENHEPFIRQINAIQQSWTAKAYPEFERLTHADVFRMKGGPKSMIASYPSPVPLTDSIIQQSRQLPNSFDWRNVDGIDYVSPIRNQGACGSCYSFASLGMIEARLRVITNNTEQPVLSEQDVVSCSTYSQGCEGGFPYLIAGRYAHDFGLTPEHCFPYEGLDEPCKEQQCSRTFVASYNYVGGFYGGCNEEIMRINLVKNGPISVAFEVYDDFMHYSGGIYHHTGLESGFNPFALTNHGVLVVGYGKDAASGESFWIVKNSWGTSWGEDGFFRIRRGTNECSIESIAVEAFPIP